MNNSFFYPCYSFPKREIMEPGPARAKANWLRLFSRVRLQLQEVQPVCGCVCVCVLVCFCAHRCGFVSGECPVICCLCCCSAEIYYWRSLTCCIIPCTLDCYCVVVWFFFQLLLTAPPCFPVISWLSLWIILSCVYLIVSVYPLYCFLPFHYFLFSLLPSS